MSTESGKLCAMCLTAVTASSKFLVVHIYRLEYVLRKSLSVVHNSLTCVKEKTFGAFLLCTIRVRLCIEQCSRLKGPLEVSKHSLSLEILLMMYWHHVTCEIVRTLNTVITYETYKFLRRAVNQAMGYRIKREMHLCKKMLSFSLLSKTLKIGI